MLEGMGIHFGDSTHDEGRSVAIRLRSVAMSREESSGNGRNHEGRELLSVGLPPLPPIEQWLIEPGNAQENQKEGGTASTDVEVRDLTGDRDSHQDAFVEEPSEQTSFQTDAARRTVPRLVFKPMQAVAVILVLVVALCASLTMLVTQAVNYNKQQAEASSLVNTRAGAGLKTKDSDQPGGNPSNKGKTSGSSSASSEQEERDSGTDAGSSYAGQPAQTGSGQNASSGNESNLVNLNTADSTQLQQIKGVGPVMAQKIINYRSSIGRFTSVDQLLKVSGIGQKTLEKIRGQVTV